MSKIKKNFGYQFVYRILSVLTPLITSPIVSRALGPVNVGAYSATQAYVNYFILLAMLGVEAYGNRSIAAVQSDKKKRQRLFWSVYTIQFSASLVSMAVYFFSFVIISEERRIISLIQGLWLLSCLLDINWFFYGMEEFKLTVTRNIIVKLLTVILVILFVNEPDDLALYALILAGSAALSQAVMWGYLGKYIHFEKPTIDSVKIHIRPIIQLFLPIAAGSVFHIMDKSMLDALSDESNVGYYYSADKIINVPLSLITAISTVMLPRISNILKNENVEAAKSLISKATEVAMAILSPVLFGICSVASVFVPLFFGAGYEPCVDLIYFFAPVLFVKTFSEAARAQYLIPSGKDRLYTTAIYCGAIANLISNYLLIRQFAAVGAVLGTLIAESVVLFIELVGMREVPFVKYIMKQYKYVIAGVFMFLVVRLLGRTLCFSPLVKLLVMIISGGSVYAVFCVLIWLSDTKSVFRGILRKKAPQ